LLEHIARSTQLPTAVPMACPERTVKDLISRYADILRVGSLRFNGESLTWCTNGSTESQLEAFVAVVLPQLQQLPDVVKKGLDHDNLIEMLLCICKAVSINYVLFDVLNLLQRKTGKLCNIESRAKNGANSAQYFVNTSPGLFFDAGITWAMCDNVTACEPGACKKQVMGTLSKVQVGFSWLPASLCERPACKVTLELKKSLLGQVLAFTCRRRGQSWEVMHLGEPLHETLAWPSVASPQSAPALNKSFCSLTPDRSRSENMDSCSATTCRRSFPRRLSFMKLLRRRRPTASCGLASRRE